MMQQLSGLHVDAATIESDTGAAVYNRTVDGVATFSAHLALKITSMRASQPDAINELENLVKKFVSEQSSSEDKCSSQMLETKHQLNQLHEIINDLAAEINSTETSIQVLEPQLTTKKEELEEVEDWKADALKKCEEEREERRKVLNTLQQELEEMHHIARPDVTMDLTKSSVSKGVAMLQEQNTLAPISHVQGLVTSTKDAASSLMKCVNGAKLAKRKVGLVQTKDPAEASSETTASPDACDEQKKVLEETYVKTYVELTRLIAEYDELIKSKSCEDAVEEEYNEKVTPIRKEIKELTEKIEELEDKLEKLRPRLEDASEAEKILRKQIKTLHEQCAELPETITDLNKVRDVIYTMSKCPGLAAAEFNIPIWTQDWVEVTQSADMTDAVFDAAMNAACAAKFNSEDHAVRAAEAGEIAAESIEGMPKTNTASGAIVGACPMCAGDDDADTGASHASGHSRVCWEVDAPLSGAGMKKGCSVGRRAVLCVYDRGNIRDIAREDLTAAGALARGQTQADTDRLNPASELAIKHHVTKDMEGDATDMNEVDNVAEENEEAAENVEPSANDEPSN
jgi:septal ring factor EnvC (AmiA/AmiB activator)